MFPLSFLTRKVDFDSWRTLEAVLRWIVLGQAAAPQQRVLAVDAPELRFGVLGHGCLDPEHAQSFDPAQFRAPNSRPAEACVIGEGALAREAIRRLVALGAQTHTTAATVEEHAAALNEGASPRRAEDLPALMPRLDIVISAGRSHFVDARLIARLPEGALIVDFAGPPGSVDFETAKGLGREVIWARKLLSAESGANIWNEIRARVEASAMSGARHDG